MSSPRHVADGIWMLRTVLVNVFFVRIDADGWMLVDAGVAGSAGPIRQTASALFGSTPPHGIVLTHGHFDHVGGLRRLLEHWDVPVYAHPFEMPHLTGWMRYAPPDPSVGGGLLARLSSNLPLADRLSYLVRATIASPANGVEISVTQEGVVIHTALDTRLARIPAQFHVLERPLTHTRDKIF